MRAFSKCLVPSRTGGGRGGTTWGDKGAHGEISDRFRPTDAVKRIKRVGVHFCGAVRRRVKKINTTRGSLCGIGGVHPCGPMKAPDK